MRAAGAFSAGLGGPKSAGLQLRFRMYFPRDPAGILRKRACGAKMLFHFTPPPGGDKGELALAGLFLKKGVSPSCRGSAAFGSLPKSRGKFVRPREALPPCSRRSLAFGSFPKPTRRGARKLTFIRTPVQRFCHVRISKRPCYRIDLSRKHET